MDREVKIDSRGLKELYRKVSQAVYFLKNVLGVIYVNIYKCLSEYT